MNDPFAKWKNPGKSTYNGAAMFAELTGLPREEIEWMARRTKELHAEGKTKAEISAAVKEEGKGRPWLSKAGNG